MTTRDPVNIRKFKISSWDVDGRNWNTHLIALIWTHAYKEVIDDINLNGSATGIGHLPLRWALVNQTEGEYIH